MERLTQRIDENRAIPRVDLRRCGHERCTTQLARYEDTGLTPDEVKELAERDMAKVPDYEGDGYADGQMVYDTWICPNCGEHYEVDYDDYDFCPKCGQRIKKHMDVNEKRFEEHETQWKRSFMKRFERRM